MAADPGTTRVDLAVHLDLALGGITDLAGVLSVLAIDETLVLVQAMVDRGTTAAPLWCATRGAVSTSPSDPPADPVQAQLWGFGRVVALEQPRLWGGLVDLPETLDDRAAAALAATLASGDEDQVAIRATGRVARRLVRAPLTGEPATPWTPRGTVLITGGTGGVGAHVARWLAANGADHLVLASRRGPDAPGAHDLAVELEALGTRVTVAACDAADRDAVAELLAGPLAENDLTAVVHAAGTVQSTTVEETTVAEFAEIMAGKVGGATHLDELTSASGTPLDAFILFSSNSGVWGSGRHSAYAAANAHLDALAEQRRARGLAATSVAWGAWAGGGMMTGDGVEDYMRRRGVLEMPPELAVSALVQAVAHGETFVAVADIDWDRFIPGFTSGRPSPLIADLPEVARVLRADEIVDVGDAAGGGLRERLAGLPALERADTVLDIVRVEVATVLGHDRADAVAPARAFKELGFDSLTAVDLRNRLGRLTGLRLPATLVFDHPTPIELADHLLGQVAPDDGEPLPVLAELARLETAMTAPAPDDETRAGVVRRLRTLLWRWGDEDAEAEQDPGLEDATADDMFALIDREFGAS
jgi:short-subunit dehydrogenase